MIIKRCRKGETISSMCDSYCDNFVQLYELYVYDVIWVTGPLKNKKTEITLHEPINNISNDVAISVAFLPHNITLPVSFVPVMYKRKFETDVLMSSKPYVRIR